MLLRREDRLKVTQIVEFLGNRTDTIGHISKWMGNYILGANAELNHSSRLWKQSNDIYNDPWWEWQCDDQETAEARVEDIVDWLVDRRHLTITSKPSHSDLPDGRKAVDIPVKGEKFSIRITMQEEAMGSAVDPDPVYWWVKVFLKR